MLKKEEWLLENPFEKLTIPDFQQQLYTPDQHNLGSYLSTLAAKFDVGTAAININEQELYYELGLRLVTLIRELPSIHANRLSALRLGTREELLRRLEIARQAIAADHDEWLDIDHIARESMLSSAHFLRSFRDVYGITPYRYHLKLRMNHAAYLLKKADMKPSQIALLCGFANLASFSKAFKKEFKHAPLHYAAG